MPVAMHPAYPSIFISSTVREFQDLRSALAYFLRSQGFSVYLSEAADFDIRGDRSALEECFENVRASDYYILIVGATRGSLSGNGVSVTRQEYRVAREAFTTATKPRLYLYLRASVEEALQRGKKAQEAAGIDYPEHLRLFIDEVQNPQAESIPNYLTRFGDANDLMVSLNTRMNLGRNLAETLTRHGLVTELASNIAVIAHRSGSGVGLYHWFMGKEREHIGLNYDDIDKQIQLSSEQGLHLLMALAGRIKGNHLRTRATEQAIDAGVFLEFNTASQTFEETSIHGALKQSLLDIRSLSSLDETEGFKNWDVRLLTAISEARGSKLSYCHVQGLDLLNAVHYYDRVEDIFNGHLALCRALLGIDAELQLPARQPITPLGPHMERKLRAEQVSAAEVIHLIQKDIAPLGKRILANVFGKSREEQIEAIAPDVRKIFSQIGLAEGVDDEVVRDVAASVLEQISVPAEEGIEGLRC